jgi:hypothetical protein
MKNNIKLPIVTKLAYTGAFVLIALGYHLIFIVNKSEIFRNNPYEYILNSNYANGYFIIALILVCLGSTFAIIENLKIK